MGSHASSVIAVVKTLLHDSSHGIFERETTDLSRSVVEIRYTGDYIAAVDEPPYRIYMVNYKSYTETSSDRHDT